MPFGKYLFGENKVKRELGIIKEFVGYLKPIMKQRYADRDNFLNNGVEIVNKVEDQLQILIDQGDKPLALIQVRVLLLKR